MPSTSIMISKGCYWGKCTFCALGPKYGKYSIKTPEKAVADIKKLKEKYNLKSWFQFQDDAIHPNYLDKLADEMNKENLNISYDLFKTMNGLANNRGGYIICGVSPDNRKLKGLSEEKISFYNSKIDSEDMRGKILSSCQPNIEYKHCMYNIGTAKFVIFYIPESRNKPHVFNQSGDGVTQGDIYFRYNDSIKKIQYASL